MSESMLLHVSLLKLAGGKWDKDCIVDLESTHPTEKNDRTRIDLERISKDLKMRKYKPTGVHGLFVRGITQAN